MDVFETLKKNITETGRIAAEKAKLLKDILVVKDQIRNNKKEIRTLIYKIGQTYLELHGEDCEDAFVEFIRGIKEAEEEKAAKEAVLADLKDQIKTTDLSGFEDDDFDEDLEEFFEDLEDDEVEKTLEDEVEETAEEAEETVEEAVEEIAEAVEETVEEVVEETTETVEETAEAVEEIAEEAVEEETTEEVEEQKKLHHSYSIPNIDNIDLIQ